MSKVSDSFHIWGNSEHWTVLVDDSRLPSSADRWFFIIGDAWNLIAPINSTDHAESNSFLIFEIEWILRKLWTMLFIYQNVNKECWQLTLCVYRSQAVTYIEDEQEEEEQQHQHQQQQQQQQRCWLNDSLLSPHWRGMVGSFLIDWVKFYVPHQHVMNGWMDKPINGWMDNWLGGWLTDWLN